MAKGKSGGWGNTKGSKQSWEPNKKPGESKSAYNKRYYTAQRVNAEETGDQKTTDKIYAKMGKASHSVDSNQVDKALLTLPLGVGRAGGSLGVKAFVGAGRRTVAGEARTAGSVVKSLKNVTPKRAALSGGKLGPKTESAGRIQTGPVKGKGFEMKSSTGPNKSPVNAGTVRARASMRKIIDKKNARVKEVQAKINPPKKMTTTITRGAKANKTMANAKNNATGRVKSMAEKARTMNEKATALKQKKGK